jgi:dUTPase
VLINLGEKDVEFAAGDRIAQIKLDPYEMIDWVEEREPDFAANETGDRTGGFGSTGLTDRRG